MRKSAFCYRCEYRVFPLNHIFFSLQTVLAVCFLQPIFLGSELVLPRSFTEVVDSVGSLVVIVAEGYGKGVVCLLAHATVFDAYQVMYLEGSAADDAAGEVMSHGVVTGFRLRCSSWTQDPYSVSFGQE